MLVTKDNFKGITAIAAVNNTGNDRIDIPGNEYITDAINRYEPEYFSKMYGSTLYSYLLDYSGTDTAILSVIQHVTEAATCYIYTNILRERKSSYNGESMINMKSEGNPAQPIEEKMIEVHNRMVQCNRNALEIFFNSLQTLWNEKECYINNTFIEFELC